MSTSPAGSNGVIYTARLIRTANPSNPTAHAIAIRDGRVLSVGSLEDCQAWGITEVDTQFADKVLTAGFVEAHAHISAGMFADIPYLGFFTRKLPDGSMTTAIKSTDELVAYLRTIDATLPAGEPLLAAGFDPIYFTTERLTCHHLDEVSTTRPIFVLHASAHLGTVNSFVLQKYDLTKDHPAPGLGRDDIGEPNGELREAGMALAKEEYRAITSRGFGPQTIQNFAATMRNAGITTSSDLASTISINDEAIASATETTNDDSFPLRVVAATSIASGAAGKKNVLERVQHARQSSHDKLMYPIVKLVLDGSIQGFTATVDWPGYITGEGHPLFLVAPEQVLDLLRPFHEANIGIHCHCNGNIAANVFIDAVEQLLIEHSWLDHRHTITHAQLMTHAQMRKAKNLGMCANFFVNHMWYWGDQHHDITVGPDRAKGLNPCATADRIGLPYSFHSDAPVTPPSHLHTMWAAVNRMAPSGRTIGNSERISIDRAFHAATIDAAYQMHVDHLVGSLEVGKFADITILDDDPYAVDPMHIRDINVWGTMVGGVVHQNP